jgi:hypothetical protein
VQVDAKTPSGTTSSIDGSTPQSGDNSAAVSLGFNQEFHVTMTTGGNDKSYYVRCLPSDFPQFTWTQYSNPTQQWYIMTPDQGVGAKPYVAIFGRGGAPVWWYKDTVAPLDAKLLPNGDLLWSHSLGAFANNNTNTTDERKLDGTLVRQIKAPGNVPTDPHDIQILPNGHIYTLSYVERSTTQDLSAYGGPTDAHVLDAQIEEQDENGNLVWTWNSKDHIDISESARWVHGMNPTPYPNGDQVYDIVHINTISLDGSDLIISLRHADAVYKINRSTGDIVWKLGGTTRYTIDEGAMTATFIKERKDPALAPSSFCCGGARELPGGGEVITFGGTNITEEFAADGTKVWTLALPSGMFGYRVVPIADGVVAPSAFRDGMDTQWPRSAS